MSESAPPPKKNNNKQTQRRTHSSILYRSVNHCICFPTLTMLTLYHKQIKSSQLNPYKRYKLTFMYLKIIPKDSLSDISKLKVNISDFLTNLVAIDI